MKNKLLFLFIIIILPSSYFLWKNSTMEEVSFDTVYNNVSLLSSRTPLEVLSTDSADTAQYDKELNTLKELYEAADVVAIVHPVSRKQISNVVNSVVEIKECFKSDYQQGQHISLFEPFYMRYYNKNEDLEELYKDKDFIDISKLDDLADLNSSGGYIPMNMDKEYFVFLKKSENYSSDQYRLLSLMHGKFPYIKSEPSILNVEVISDSSVSYPLKELLEYDMVVYDMVEDEVTSSSESADTKELTEKYNEYNIRNMKMLKSLINNEYKIIE